MKKQYDVVIIGAGVVGSAIARELSRYKLSIAVLEKNLDVCNETSGRNSAVVHGGFANPTGSLKAKCCVEGNKIMDQLAEELDFPFKRCGKVLVGNTPEDMEQLERTMKQGAVNGCTGLEMIDEKKLHELVPAVVGKFAMWSKNSGIMDPFLYTVALAENAHANGVDFFFDHKVTAITRENELYYLHTEHGDVCTRWVVNAAGLGAKQISDLLGLTGYRVIGSRSNYIILHKRMGKLLPMPVYPVPSNTYMGIHITPTVDGNVTIGPDAETADVVQMVLAGKINKTLVNLIGQKGGRAIGLSGIDGQMIRARVRDERLGYVGEITKVDVRPILDVLDKGYIPVVSTVGCDTQGHVYNINADTAAARIAGELGAESLIAMTDIGGILRDQSAPASLIPVICLAEAQALIASGVICGGMLPKVTCCMDAIRWGVHRVFIIDGRVPHAILIEMLTNEGIGTMFVAG